jgi:hypothetical protein
MAGFELTIARSGGLEINPCDWRVEPCQLTERKAWRADQGNLLLSMT